MKRLCLLIIAFYCLGALPVFAVDALDGDMGYLGYSDNIRDFARQSILKRNAPTYPVMPTREKTREELLMDEAQAVQEQLTELGRTRSLNSDTPVRAQEAKEKLDSYWNDMQPSMPPAMDYLSPEFKGEIRNRLSNTLIDAGYEIKQLDLIDIPNVPQVRAIIKVVKPLKTKDAYREIQTNLSEIKQISLAAATVNGFTYLSELSTFLAENPENRYFYEKTVLTP